MRRTSNLLLDHESMNIHIQIWKNIDHVQAGNNSYRLAWKTDTEVGEYNYAESQETNMYQKLNSLLDEYSGIKQFEKMVQEMAQERGEN